MRKGFLSVVLVLFVFYWIPAYAATLSPAAVPKVPKAATPAVPIPAPPAPTLPPPANLSLLNITTPNGGEKWVIGSMQNITWTTNLNGYCMVELYRGSTSPQTRVGMIGSGTQISNRIMSWKVGSYDGGTGTAPPGDDYWIVIKSEAVAKSDASNGPFTLMAITASPSASTPLLSTDKKELSATSTGLKLSTPSEVVKILSLTYPRRADGFNKGILYKITWKSMNLNDTKLKLELLDAQETTVLQNIGENFDNTGEKLWDVPMSLPDERKLYKIRIQTMDGTKSDIVPIWIAKGAAPAGPPTLKVTNPGMGDRAIGDTIPIKWTSTTTCSGPSGPLDDRFYIELIGKTTNGVNVSKLLTDAEYVFDNEGPAGVINYHWDWQIVRGGFNPGTYQIRVKNYQDKCIGTSKQFRIFDSQPSANEPPKTDSVLLTAQFTNKKACYAEVYDTAPDDAKCPQFPAVPSGQGQVGSVSNYRDLGGNIAASEHSYDYTKFRSRIYFPVNQVSMQKRTLKYANLHIEVKMKKSAGAGDSYQFCASNLYRLTGPWNNCMDLPIDLAGIAVPNGNSVIDIHDIRVTSIVKDWLSGATPNNGFLLTEVAVPPASYGVRRSACWTYYTALLYLEFDKTE